MINRLTNQEVSKEMVDILERLSKNISVPYEEIKELPEVKFAYSCINESISTDKLKFRDGLHEGIQKKIQERGSVEYNNGEVTYSGEVKRDRRADIVIGLPAAGKSSTLVEPISNEFNSRVVDSDEIKKLIPEFNNGWGADVVHQESKKINNKVLEETADREENFVLPIVGSKLEKVEKYITALKALDYKVYLHYNELPINKAIGRVLNRFLEEGRFIDPKIIYNYGDKVARVYENIKTKGDLIDGYSKFNNDVKRGEKPRLIESNCRGRIWSNEQSEIYSDNTENARGERRRNVTGIRKLGSKEDETKNVRQEIKRAGYIPKKKLVDNIMALNRKRNIDIEGIRNMLKDSNLSGEEKSLLNEINKELKLQGRKIELER